MAANYTVEERNSELKFHFMLHADKKSKSKWKDFDLPFPKEVEVKDKSGITGIPDNMKAYVYKED